MSLILNVDTAVQSASICLARDNHIVDLSCNPSQKDHASWLHLAIKDVILRSNYQINNLDAIAVSAGPGSYTGLRVGMAAAKGLCYALNIPLLTISTLKMMAVAGSVKSKALLCPMIDARRMEVFTAIYDQQLSEKLSPTNLILDQNSFGDFLHENDICFFGNGSVKFKNICHHPHALFAILETTAEHMVSLSYENFSVRNYTNLAYAEPFYGKDFYSTFK